MSTERPRVRIIHDTDPQKYFPALFALADAGEIELVGAHRYSVLKQLARSVLRGKLSVRSSVLAAWPDLRFRARLPLIRDEILVIGFAPWDWRVLLYAPLLKRNRIIYHTSRPKWQPDSIPHRYGPLTSFVKQAWLRFLRHPRLQIVAVLPVTQTELRQQFDITSHVIPHAVPEQFFNASSSSQPNPKEKLSLVYVGELSEKKGVRDLLETVSEWPEIDLTLIGDGPLRDECRKAAQAGKLRMRGPIWNRQHLADELGRHDILLLLSRRQGVWEELFGIVLTEAMACGLGVIATNHVGPRTILGASNLNNLFAEGDLAGVHELLQQLASDPEKVASFRRSHSGLAEPYRLRNVSSAWMSIIAKNTGSGD